MGDEDTRFTNRWSDHQFPPCRRAPDSRVAALEAECGRLRDIEPRIREYLAFSHQDGKCYVYADDGELQCANLARHGRTIDFRREPIGDLLDIIINTRRREYADLSPQPEAKEET